MIPFAFKSFHSQTNFNKEDQKMVSEARGKVLIETALQSQQRVEVIKATFSLL